MTTPPRSTASHNGTSSASTQLADEILRIRERFSAYERLDKQLDEMVSGLTELLQGAAELRRRTNEDITNALTRLETLIASDRQQQRRLLSSLHTDLAAAHQRTTALSTSLDEIQGTLTAIATRLPGPSGETVSIPATTPAITSGPASPLLRQLAIRDVPDVATALTIQGAIAEHPAVSAMQTREFAAGELRLHVELRAPLTADALSLLVGGALKLVDHEADRLILRYEPVQSSAG